jgi:hypothetical protein
LPNATNIELDNQQGLSALKFKAVRYRIVDMMASIKVDGECPSTAQTVWSVAFIPY